MYSCSWAPTSAAAADQAKQKGEGKSKGEYLAYSARLKPKHSKQYAIVSKWMKRLYSELFDRSTRVRGKVLGLSKTSIFTRVFKHKKRIANSLYSSLT